MLKSKDSSPITFIAQIKKVQRLSKVSNDTEYQLVLVTETPLTDLMEIMADELVEVSIKLEDDQSWGG